MPADQPNHHAPARDGNFYPFKWVFGDFDFDAFAERLRFRHLQKELFKELIEQLEIKIWFWDADPDKKDYRHDSPGIELNVFWRDYHVSSVNLFDMLQEPFENLVNEIGYEEEINVLNKLKTKIEQAIEMRQEELQAATQELANARPQ